VPFGAPLDFKESWFGEFRIKRSYAITRRDGSAGVEHDAAFEEVWEMGKVHMS
jgi:hypothetical protein